MRLSGEIADQAVLDSLRRTYPEAAIGHAYASTEAGVGFEVDGRAAKAFRPPILDRHGPLAMKVEDGSLRIRSDPHGEPLSRERGRRRCVDADGFVDTGDMVEQRGDRLYFVGRRSGIINVGGLKVHPEEVEAVINRHARRPHVARARRDAARSRARSSWPTWCWTMPPARTADPAASRPRSCRPAARTCRHKVPVLVRFVPELDVTPAGKLRAPSYA